MAFNLRSIHLPHRKNTAEIAAVKMDAPKAVTLPTSMHIGAPATVVVKVGDHVDVGTLVAEQNGVISSPVYASVSGTVKKIEPMGISNGSVAPAVTIESDGEMTYDPSIAPPSVNDRASFIEAVKKSGIVGLGGAGFPTYVKLDVDTERVEELIINAAECEPYITSDTRAMLEYAEDIELALEAFEKYLGVKKIIFGIENNKKEPIRKMQEIAAKHDAVSVKVLPSKYPQGGEKVMIYHVTGKVVPGGKLPIDVGCIVINCSTVAAIGKYLRTGIPLVDRLVTVDGSAVKNPMNVIVPLGTSLEDVFEFTGGFKETPGKVLYGGPMMGIAVPSLSLPIIKNNNAILAFNEKDSTPIKVTNCIRCGSCTNLCPFGLNPAAIADAYRLGDVDKLKKLRVDLCMECGTCAYRCPANRPIIQTHKLAKAALRDAKAREEAKRNG
ncbi:MAG: electron transport complex subunit RsxC [Clostridia bacterium]|nr:electron transport complex subunit RsxC [Clostridia bacterium]